MKIVRVRERPREPDFVRKPLRWRLTVLAIGLIVSIAAAAAWHGPLGGADRFRTTIERQSREALDYYEMTKVTAHLHRAPLTRRLVQVLLEDPEPLLFHAEPVLRDGKPVGYVRAASYGHTLGGAVGLAMIDANGTPLDAPWIDAGRWEVDIAGTRYPARASLKPLYDPANAKIKA